MYLLWGSFENFVGTGEGPGKGEGGGDKGTASEKLEKNIIIVH